jgi:phosphoglycolate phosphatase
VERKFFIFDWDGTLCDSTAKICLSMQKAAVDCQQSKLSTEQVMEIIGLGLPEAIAQLVPGITDDAMLAMRDAYARRFIEADQVPCNLFPGVRETLDELRAQGHYLAVATGKARKGLDRVLGSVGLDGFFDTSRCADETASKPHPKMLNELLAEMAHPLEASVMVGDTEFDMDMARRAGMPMIAVDYGAHHADRLKRYDLLACVSEFSEIARWSKRSFKAT